MLNDDIDTNGSNRFVKKNFNKKCFPGFDVHIVAILPLEA